MSAPDYHEIKKIEEAMKTAALNLHKMEGPVASAITIVDYDSDRRKSLVARYAVKHIKNGESAAAADTLARADEAYIAELNGLRDAYELAQTVRKQDENERLSWETGRSLLARQRKTLVFDDTT
jgi:hypothetical protein